MNNLLQQLKNNKKIAFAILALLLIITAITVAIVLTVKTTTNHNSHEANNTHSHADGGHDEGNEVMEKVHSIDNYTFPDKCMFPAQRNLVINAIGKAQLLNKSTVNNKVDLANDPIPESAKPLDVYPTITSGQGASGHFDDEYSFIDGNVNNGCTLNFTTTDNKKIRIIYKPEGNVGSGGQILKYPYISVTFI